MKIGELAQETNTGVETIRYYERVGLLPPPRRTAGNYRDYDERHGARLAFIRRCRSLDMNLDEVRALLSFRDAPHDNCCEVNQLLDAHINHVSARLRELRRLEKELRALRAQCRRVSDNENCEILNSLSAAGAAKGGSKSHFDNVHAASTDRKA